MVQFSLISQLVKTNKDSAWTWTSQMMCWGLTLWRLWVHTIFVPGQDLSRVVPTVWPAGENFLVDMKALREETHLYIIMQHYESECNFAHADSEWFSSLTEVLTGALCRSLRPCFLSWIRSTGLRYGLLQSNHSS